MVDSKVLRYRQLIEALTANKSLTPTGHMELNHIQNVLLKLEDDNVQIICMNKVKDMCLRIVNPNLKASRQKKLFAKSVIDIMGWGSE